MRVRMHPVPLLISAIGCLLAAAGFFTFRGIMASEGIGEDPTAILIGFSFDFVEIGVFAFIISPIAPKVAELLGSWGFKSPSAQLERLLDFLCLLGLLFVYTFDSYVVYQGCQLREFSRTISLSLAILQLPMFEILLNIGFWLLEEFKLSQDAVTQVLEESQQSTRSPRISRM